MLRPATPLSVVLFVAFALILLSVLSTPIIEAIPLSTFEDVSFGVFGFCDGGDCTGIQIGYDVCKSTSPLLFFLWQVFGLTRPRAGM